MRRVDCRDCGVKVEALPWANGKHTLTRAYMLFLAQWALQAVLERDSTKLPDQLGESL